MTTTLLYVESQKQVQPLSGFFRDHPGADVFPAGIAIEKAVHDLISASPDVYSNPVLEYAAVNSAIDNYLKTNLIQYTDALVAILAATAKKAGAAADALIPPYGAGAVSATLMDHLFMELRPLLLLKNRFRAGGYEWLEVAARPGANTAALGKFFAHVTDNRYRIVLSHLPKASQKAIEALKKIDPFLIPARFRTSQRHDAAAIAAFPFKDAPVIFTTLANARGAALIMPLVTGLQAHGPVAVFVHNAMSPEGLAKVREQYGVAEQAKFFIKGGTGGEPVPHPAPDHPAIISAALRGWHKELRRNDDPFFRSAAMIIIGVVRRRIPALLQEVREFDAMIDPAIRVCHSVTTSPATALDAGLAIGAARLVGVRTVEVQRGVVAPEPRLVKPLSDHLLAIDDFSRDVYVDYLGCEPETIRVVGSLKLDVDLNPYRRLSAEAARTDFPTLAGLDGKKVFLLIGQPLGAEIMGVLAELVIGAAAKRDDLHVMVKLHPEEGDVARAHYTSIAEKHGLAAFSVVGNQQPVAKAIVAADYVATYFSTTGLEAFALGRRTICLNPFEGRPPFDLAALGVATEIRSSNELERFLDSDTAAKAATPHLQMLKDGRSRDRVTEFIRNGDAAETVWPETDEAPILNLNGLKVAARAMEAAEGARPTLAMLEREKHFSHEVRGMLGVYANLSVGNLDAAYRGFVYYADVDSTVAIPAEMPSWDGESIPERLVVWAPVGIGIGAEIMHMGFLGALAPLFPRLILIVDDRLVGPTRHAYPALDVRPRTSFALPEASPALPHTTIMSLGRLAKLATGGYARASRFLAPDPAAAARIRKSISARPRKLVGIGWKTTNRKGTWRNVKALVELIETLPSHDVTYVNLQHGVTSEEKTVLDEFGVLTPRDLDPIGDVPGYMGYVAALDQVVTTPNSIVHFAGSVGTPTILLSPEPAVPEWRPGNADRMWYDCVRMVRYEQGEAAEQAAFAKVAQMMGGKRQSSAVERGKGARLLSFFKRFSEQRP